MHNHRLLAHVHQVVHLVTQDLGDAFSLARLLWFIERMRAKLVRLEERPLPVGTPGCFALRDTDVIFVRSQLDDARWLLVRLHECSHFLLQHVPQQSNRIGHYTFEEFLTTPDLEFTLLRSLATRPTSAEDQEREDAAELLATLLAPHVHLDHTLSQAARTSYGYDTEFRDA